ncbi:MAG: amino acid ABC transporter permease [Azospirillaceae bacterium]|nr:amino acid ABC transporter permease [Azospirillaceae bacterium]
MDFNFGLIWKFAVPLAQGLGTSILLSLICMALGSLLGLALALARSSPSRLLRLPAVAFVELFRGTPVLIQLFWVFFCLPLVLGFEPASFTSGVVALSLFTGAVTSETFRAALRSIGSEQRDASVALGLSRWTRMRYVILPQMALRATPVLLSNSITLFKETALVAAVGISDLMSVGENISNSIGRPVEILTTVAVVYFVIAFPFTRIVTLLEKRLLRKLAL